MVGTAQPRQQPAELATSPGKALREWEKSGNERHLIGSYLARLCGKPGQREAAIRQSDRVEPCKGRPAAATGATAGGRSMAGNVGKTRSSAAR